MMSEKEIIQQRISLCRSCEERGPFATCKVCKCYMPAKVLFRAFGCPLGKWLPVSKANQG